MKSWIHSICIVCLLAHCLLAADPPATQADKFNGDAQRLEFIGKQLSADEATISAINKALKLAGYHAADAADKAAGAAKGNEIMDRKGGAPVPWQEFYGRTAKSFIMHDPYGEYYQVQRPDQFNNIYKANNDQIAKAQADIDALGKKVDKLLARRRELEADQSSLWARIAFESIQNRDISTQRPFYTDQLTATPSKTDDNRPDGARVLVMRAAALYMRTIDNADVELSDSLDTDQESVYTALRDTLREAQKRLSKSIGDFADTPGVDPAEVAQMKDISGQTRQIQSVCKDICDAYRKAQDADAAGEGEEQRKLIFRGTLQESLLSFAEAVGHLDESLMKMSAAWEIHGQPGTKNADEPLAVIMPSPTVHQLAADSASSPRGEPVSPPPAARGSTASSVTPSAITSVNASTPVLPQTGRRIDLLKLVDPQRDVLSGTWTFNDGVLTGATVDTAMIEFPYVTPLEYDYRLVFKVVRFNFGICPMCCGMGHQFQWVILKNRNGLGFVDNKSSSFNSTTNSNVKLSSGQECEIVVKIRRDNVQTYLNGVLAISFKTDYGNLSPVKNSKLPHDDTLGLNLIRSDISLESAEVIEITGQGKLLRPAK